MTRVAYVSTYVPQRCGLATYTYHLRQAVNEAKKRNGRDPVAVISRMDVGCPKDPLLWTIRRDQPEDYVKMARRINRSDVDVVSLQHEFGIFGGEAGSFILDFVRSLEKPLVTTFHTVFEQPQPPYAAIQREIADLSDKIVVMNHKAAGFLNRSFGVQAEKIVFIPHGTPVPNAGGRQRLRERLGWSDRKVLMTFGLLSRGKGIELMLNALPQIAGKVPNVLYAIVGQTHPEVRKREGERYREELTELIRRNGMERNVVMIDRYMEESELADHILACDIYVTPYPGMQQITSGTLAYAVGLGRPVLSTPYSYAQDLLSGYPELLIPYEDEQVWVDRTVSLLTNDALLQNLVRQIEAVGRKMHWPKVGETHLKLFEEASRLEPVAG